MAEQYRFDPVLFSPGSGLVTYKGSDRKVIGQILFDSADLKVSLEITDPELYKQLTSLDDAQDSPLIISAPAANREEAEAITMELKGSRSSGLPSE